MAHSSKAYQFPEPKMKMNPNEISLKLSEDDKSVGYVYLGGDLESPTYQRVAKSVHLNELMDYTGPDIVFDFNEKNEIVGIEIVG